MPAEVEAPADLEQEVPAIVDWARSLAITTSEEFADAGERLTGIKGAMKRAAEFFKPLKQSADEAKRRILDAEKKITGPLTEAESLCKSAMLTYQRAEEERRLAEQRRLQAIADEQARQVREKAEQEAARQRQIELEARAKAESARREAEQANAAERKKLLAAAQAAERKAEAAAVKVEAKQEQCAAAVAPVVHVQTSAPRATGIATRKVWKARVLDATKVPREFLVVDEKKLDGYAKAMKEQARVEGVQFYTEESMSARGR